MFFTHNQTFDDDNSLLTHNGESVTIDADGNLTTIAAGVSPENYSYDVRNRLQTAGALTYTYDAENRRVAQTDGTNTTTYVINPNAALDQVLMKTVGEDTTYYVYGLGLLHDVTGTTVRYYHFDRRGDTVLITNDSGTVTGTAAYGVFGEMVSSSGTLGTPFLFNGRWGVQTDSNGIYYHRARYYHPSLRRFLNQDVLLGSITNGASMNRFAYANGNPVSMIDPFGLAAQDALPRFNTDIYGREIPGYWERVDNSEAVAEAYGRYLGALDAEAYYTAAWYFHDYLLTPSSYTEGIDFIVNGMSVAMMTGPGGLKSPGRGIQVESKIDRALFRAEREAFWKTEAKANSLKYSSENIVRMEKGRAPIGSDGFPIELHHVNRTPEGGVKPMTRTDHRIGDNFIKNHPRQE